MTHGAINRALYFSNPSKMEKRDYVREASMAIEYGNSLRNRLSDKRILVTT